MLLPWRVEPPDRHGRRPRAPVDERGSFPRHGEDTAANASAVAVLDALAEHYWRGETTETPFVEVLAEKLWQYTGVHWDGRLPPRYSEWRVQHGRAGQGH
jgi:hypothetical protein